MGPADIAQRGQPVLGIDSGSTERWHETLQFAQIADLVGSEPILSGWQPHADASILRRPGERSSTRQVRMIRKPTHSTRRGLHLRDAARHLCRMTPRRRGRYLFMRTVPHESPGPSRAAAHLAAGNWSLISMTSFSIPRPWWRTCIGMSCIGMSCIAVGWWRAITVDRILRPHRTRAASMLNLN